jgi:hypothetical protein
MRKFALVGVLSVAAGLLTAIPVGTAHAETEIVVYKNEVSQPDTRSGGHVTWPIGGGIRLQTDSNTSLDKATFAFATGADAFVLGSGLIDHDVNVRSGGEQALPGIQIYTGSGAVLLVHEPSVYGDDIWLTNGSPAALRQYAPSCDGDPSLPGMTSDQAIASGHCQGGGGSAWHGSQSAWASALTAAGYDNSVVGLGESLGSGIKGNVLVTSINAGDTYWTFSRQNAPAPEPVTVDPTSRVVTTIDTSCRQAVFNVSLPAPGPNENYGPYDRVGFRFVSAGATILRSTVGTGDGTISRTVTFTRSNTNVPRVKIFVTSPGQAPTGYPNVLKVDLGVNRRCDMVGG